jgi:hypothetical protein
VVPPKINTRTETTVNSKAQTGVKQKAQTLIKPKVDRGKSLQVGVRRRWYCLSLIKNQSLKYMIITANPFPAV